MVARVLDRLTPRATVLASARSLVPAGDERGQVVGVDVAPSIDEAHGMSGGTEHALGRPSGEPQVAHAGVAVSTCSTSASATSSPADDERTAAAASRPRSRANRICRPVESKQVVAADHEIDSLRRVIDGDGELIRPVALAIAQQQVAALSRGILRLRAVRASVKRSRPGIQTGPPAENLVERQGRVPAGARVSQFGPRRVGRACDLAAGAADTP